MLPLIGYLEEVVQVSVNLFDCNNSEHSAFRSYPSQGSGYLLRL